jgi:hypothetical protein
MSAQPAGGVYALLADGTTVEIRLAALGDSDAVLKIHRAMSPDNTYFRFFSMNLAAGERESRRICREPSADQLSAAGLAGRGVSGVASYEAGGRTDTAEIALAVADHATTGRIATLLLEHLVSAARGRGVRTFTAEVLSENSAMLKVFVDAGCGSRRKVADVVTDLGFDLPGDGADPGWEPYLDAVAAQEGRADVASLRHVLAAESVGAAVQLGSRSCSRPTCPAWSTRATLERSSSTCTARTRCGPVYRALVERFGARMSAALIQPMVIAGTEAIIGVAQEPEFGPLVIFGLGGVASDVLEASLTVHTMTAAAALIRSIRAAPAAARPPWDRGRRHGALQDILMRASRLADVPQVAELDLRPAESQSRRVAFRGTIRPPDQDLRSWSGRGRAVPGSADERRGVQRG